MKSLIYRQETANPQALDRVAQSLEGTLKFNTREEYLLWVSEWKADYKVVLYTHMYNKLNSMHAVRPEKVAAIEARLNNLVAPPEMERYNKIVQQFKLQFGWDYSVCSVWIIWYMLALRIAGKKLAAKKRAESLAE